MRSLLPLSLYRGVNDITIVVGGVSEALYHFPAHHFGHVIGVDFDDLPIKIGRHRGVLGDELLRSSIMPRLAIRPRIQSRRPFPFVRIAQGVITRRGFWHPRQHGVLRETEIGEGLAVIGFGGGLKAIGSVAKEYAVNIQLENLFLAKPGLDLKCQQNLGEFSEERSDPG